MLLPTALPIMYIHIGEPRKRIVIAFLEDRQQSPPQGNFNQH